MSNPTPIFSFIIPCYNSTSSLKKLLTSIYSLEATHPFEVLVVDNNSHDFPEKIVQYFSHCRLLHCGLQGAGAARNAGAAQAQGQYLIFVDADVVLHPLWLKNLSETYNQFPWVDLVAGTLEPGLLKNRKLYALRKHLLAHKTFGTGNFLSLDPAVGTPLMNTALCSIRASKFKALGGFTSELKRHEDWDLTDRAIHSSLHLKSLSLPGLVYFDHDRFWSYFKRSYFSGYWFPIHEAFLGRKKMPNPFPMIFPRNGTQEPGLEFLRIINSAFFVMGHWLGSRYARSLPQKILPRLRNDKNPIFFNFSLKGKSFGLDPYISIINHAQGINLFHGTHYVQLNSDDSHTFLKCFRGQGPFHPREETLQTTWIQKNIFIPLD